jgi:nucleoid-associated protein YgaU
MGIFSFVREVGEKLGLVDGSPDPEKLAAEVREHGLDAEDLDVRVEGDTVRVSGKTATQELREKIILTLGNVTGIGKVEEDIAVAAPADEATFYTVRKGDTLWAIAKKHYGNGARYSAIFEANRPMLKHPDKIYPGQSLRIPKEG